MLRTFGFTQNDFETSRAKTGIEERVLPFSDTTKMTSIWNVTLECIRIYLKTLLRLQQ